MTTVSLSPAPILQFFDNDGVELNNGTLLTQVAGTNYPTWSEPTGTVALPNPILLNSRGEVATQVGTSSPLYLDPSVSYTFSLADASGNPIWTQPNVTAPVTQAGVPALITQSLIGSVLYPTLSTEVGVTNNAYIYGNPRRYGCVGDGVANDTGGLQNCINSNPAGNVTFYPGDVYAVSTVTFPKGGPNVVDFNGGYISGSNTSTATSCIVAIQCTGTVFYGYEVFGLGNGTTILNPNPNYTCATWWYNAAGGSQYNVFFGMKHNCCQRAVVYGALPGNAPSGGIQSENMVYGFVTIGCANPWYNNAEEGFVHFSEPIFAVNAINWTSTFPATTSRALEMVVGSLLAQGGEMENADSAVGFAADLMNCDLVGMNFETAAPIRLVGDGVQITSGSIFNTNSATNAFQAAAGITGTLTMTGTSLGRNPSTGSFSAAPMIDVSSAAAGFTVVLQDTTSSEWNWNLVGSTARLVNGGVVSYRNHRMQKTAAAGFDNNYYVLNTNPTDSLIPDLTLDHMGYTTTGWINNIITGGGTNTLTNSTATAPGGGYLGSQLTLVASGTSRAQSGDPTSLTTIKAAMQRVRPNELYWLSAWVRITAGSNANLMCAFYSILGTDLGIVEAADGTAIGSNVWTFVEGPILTPASAAYMAIGVQANIATVEFTDVRIRRAS